MTSLSTMVSALQSPSFAVHGVQGSAGAYGLAQFLRQHPARSMCVVVADDKRAEALASDLRFFSGEAIQPCLFAPLEIPYRALPSPAEIKAARLAALLALTRQERVVLIAPLTALQQHVPPPSLFRNTLQAVHPGIPLGHDSFMRWLQEAGYVHAPLVEDIGTMAIRGSVIDCWPAHTERPIRIELDFDTIASLRFFDQATQRSLGPCAKITIGPADTILYTEASQREALRLVKERADAADLPVPARRDLVHALQHQLRPPFLEHLLSLFYPAPATLFDFFPADTLLIAHEPQNFPQLAAAYTERVQQAAREAEALSVIVPPTEVVVEWPALVARLQAFAHGEIGETLVGTIANTPAVDVGSQSTRQVRMRAQQSGDDPMTPIVEFLKEELAQRRRITVVCHTTLAAERTLDLLRWHGLPVTTESSSSHTIHVTIGQLSAGFCSPADALLYLTEPELFGEKIRRQPPKRPSTAETFMSFHDLADGDPVVHEHHGIGRYLGLVTMHLPGAAESDFLQLEYLGGDKLYLPVYRLGQLQRYIGPSDAPPMLDRLGGTRWRTVRTRVMQSIRAMAHDLLKIYATRKIRQGTAFSGRDHVLEEFEATFPYDETPDQWRAIEETLQDMQSERPMDRLICGDVGYGKTEVAMRAAFRAAMDGKQVAVLCPTTLLAFQHFQTFSARFQSSPLQIDLLNRFRSKEEQKATVQALAQGTVDIIIGTHRLIQRDIAMPRLGLLIIDEEQRFGVSHKERLRKLKETVDTLSLSATPIPRTLHMSMSGMRDVSIIQTPPADRQSVRTYVVPFEDRLIREAILRELERGGQIFFVHNRVQTIASMKDHLLRLLPQCRIVIAHGQMEEDALETAMQQFVKREADVLLCTSIIEAGLDIPAANTLIVNRADTFGLAQLYQIRGRVGRSNLQAFAYLLIPAHADLKDGSGLTPVAARRLATLARYTELGSGFSIAMHDLEMRGAGNLLGAQQSGHIEEIGYELFARLLERTIRQLQGEGEEEDLDPEITVPLAARLPEEYIGDPSLRVVWYKRLSSCSSESVLEQAEAELADRFGPLPEQAKNLLQVIRLRLAAIQLKLESIQVQGPLIRIKFHPQTPLSGTRLLKHVAKHFRTHSIRPDGTLHVTLKTLPSEEIFSTVHRVLHELETECLACHPEERSDEGSH